MNMSQVMGKRLPEIPVGPDLSRPHPHTSVGIEVELEGIPRRGVDDVQLKRWNIVADGSLQNGTEYVSEPVWGTAITDALDELRDVLAEQTPHVSFRTSVHVHVNILDMEPEQLARMIKMYILYEPALFRIHETWNRKDCIFCVPCRRSRHILEGYSSFMRDLARARCSGSYIRSKYSAMNINSASQLGTLEFRHMGGTTNVDEIDAWINIILQLKAAAITNVDIYDSQGVWRDYEDRLTILQEDIDKGRLLINQLRMWS